MLLCFRSFQSTIVVTIMKKKVVKKAVKKEVVITPAVMGKEITIDVMQILGDSKDTIRAPRKVFGQNKNLTESVIFFIVVTLVGSVFAMLYSFLLSPVLTQYSDVFNSSLPVSPTITEAVTVVLVGVVVVTVLSFVWAGLLHGWLKLFRGKGTYADTYSAFSYSRAPLSLLGWIPVIGNLAALYSFYILALGISVKHQMRLRKALLLMVPVVVLVIVAQIASFLILAGAAVN